MSKPKIELPESPKLVDWVLLKNSFTRIKNGILTLLPFVILIAILIYFIYYILSYFYELRRRYNCFSIKNLFNGNIFKCLDDQPEYCKDINSDLYWGWCMDPDYYGSYPGDQNGAYGISCNRWIFNPNKCPPINCKGKYPVGIKINDSNNQIQEYGWCADPEINRALRGNYCGPQIEERIKCKNWIWDESKCPLICPNINFQPVNLSQTIDISAPIKQKAQIGKCSLICGIKDGKQIPCPPTDCNDSNESCQCKK